MFNLMLAAILICSATIFTSCSDDNAKKDNDLTMDKLVGVWVADYSQSGTEGDLSWNRVVEDYYFSSDGTGYYECYRLDGDKFVKATSVRDNGVLHFTISTSSSGAGGVVTITGDKNKMKQTLTYADGKLTALNIQFNKATPDQVAFIYELYADWQASNSGDDDDVKKKGYPLSVTVNATANVTLEDDGTRATYNDETKKLAFSAGDQLFVQGYDIRDGGAGWFAGTLNMVSAGTFSGTIYTEKEYTSTAGELLTAANLARATLLPSGYETHGYLSVSNSGTYITKLSRVASNAFATAKATAVEQFSYEYGDYSGTGFVLTPRNAILNFTIAGLAASTAVDVALTGPSELNITRSVTTDESGNATFAVGVEGGTDLNNLSLTVGSYAITLTSSSKTLEAGKIYNVSWSASPLAYATAEDIGKVIGADGKIYANAAAAIAAGTTAVAMIAYVGSDLNCAHGLAIQLNSKPAERDWGGAKTYAAGLTKVIGGTWRLPSNADWQNMFLACRKDGDASGTLDDMNPQISNSMYPIIGFKEKILATGISWMSAYYWSSTDVGGDSGEAWIVGLHLVGYDKPDASFCGDGKQRSHRVLACLAF